MSTDGEMIDRDGIAKMLGINKDVLRKRVESRPDFPKPAMRLSRKTVRWRREAIESWLAMEESRAADGRQ